MRTARNRRDVFKAAFESEADIEEVIPSGSLARGTQKDPIHDVDVVLIYHGIEHPEWGESGASAEDALDYVRSKVNFLLGATNGDFAKVVRLARWQNHAVKCFLDDPDDPDAFTVDAMPALRRDGMLLIPEATTNQWVSSNPEYLIEKISEKHAAWNKFAGTIRMFKWWASEQDTKIKSLVMEVLALQFLPVGLIQPQAIKQFFVRASYFIDGGNEVCDPANVCGPIQHDLNYGKFGDLLREARDGSVQAIQAQLNNDTASAIRAWGKVFGDHFPPPPRTGDPAAPAIAPVMPRPVKDTPQG